MGEANSGGARKQNVLFLCTQNSARSQMAEGLLRHLAGDRFEAYSAGIDPTDEIHPCAVEAMREVGIDISDQYPKGLKTYMGKMSFNYLIIVCARAEERCPKTFPGVGTTFSWIFDDPRRDEDLPFDEWFDGLGEEAQEDVALAVEKLEERGPALPRPLADTVEGSRHSNMKELRPLGTNIRVLLPSIRAAWRFCSSAATRRIVGASFTRR